MGYNLKYKLEYASRGNYTTTVEILKMDFEGEVIELVGNAEPFELVYESSSNTQFSTFLNSHATLIVKSTQVLKNDFQEIEDEDDYILRYRRDGQIKWTGYLLQEQFTEGDDNNSPFISLKFYDAISRLKIFTISDLELPESNTYSLYEILSAINAKLYHNFNPDSDILFNRYLQHIFDLYNDLLGYVFIKSKSLVDSDGIELNLYEVLERLGDSFNFTFLLYVDRLAIHNFEYSKNPRFLDYGNGMNNLILNQHRNVGQNHFWITKSKFTTFRDASKKVEVYHKFDDDPDFINFERFNQIVKLRDFASTPDPIITENSIEFNTYNNLAAVDGTKSYKDISVGNPAYYQITNTLPENQIPDFFKLKFKLKMEFDYGIDGGTFPFLPASERQAIEDKVRQVEENTTVRGFFQYKTTVDNGATTNYLIGGSFGMASTTTPSWMEINGNAGLTGFGFDRLIEGVDIDIDFLTLIGTNQVYLIFYQPQVYTNVGALSGSNQIRILGVKYTISDVSIVRKGEINMDEIRYEGKTNRNIFNYNLEADQEFHYLDIEQTGYPFTMVLANGQPLQQSSFYRKNTNYDGLKLPALSIHSMLVIQTLEQRAFQQKNITGDLMVRNDPSFDIMSSLTVDYLNFGILSYKLQDKSSVYGIELLEIK